MGRDEEKNRKRKVSIDQTIFVYFCVLLMLPRLKYIQYNEYQSVRNLVHLLLLFRKPSSTDKTDEMSALAFFIIAAAFTIPMENVSAAIPTTLYGSPSVPTTNIASTPATLDAVVSVKAAYETGMVDKIKQVTFLTLE